MSEQGKTERVFIVCGAVVLIVAIIGTVICCAGGSLPLPPPSAR